MNNLKCSVCHKEVEDIYEIGNDAICFKCFNDIFNGTNSAKVNKYIKSLHEQIKESNEVLDDYHRICESYEAYCDKCADKYTDTLNKIKNLIRMYCKGIGTQIYKDHILPILKHVDWFITKGINDEESEESKQN